ncbi:hypothetical protein LPJ59_002113 [Coemansia sp. RSA 2399]|nr:hypothetical protein LPJ59_002113 [Coemansia sp. RSA 2399]
MSANEFLDVLRDYDLEHQYPCLYGSGITSLDRLVEINNSKLHAFGITSNSDVANLQALIGDIRSAMQMNNTEPPRQTQQQAQQQAQHQIQHQQAAKQMSGQQGYKRVGFATQGDSDDDAPVNGSNRNPGAAENRTVGVRRPGIQSRVPARRPSSIYTHSNGSSSGIPRATPSGPLSPPIQPTNYNSPVPSMGHSEFRGSGRQGLPPPGNPAVSKINRRQTLVSSSHGYGNSRIGDGTGLGLHGVSGISNNAASRSKTMALRNGAGRGAGPVAGTRPSIPNMADVLERSKTYAMSQSLADDSDEDLERVVRSSGKGGLVNAYGIPVRPTTGHAKRSASERRSIAPGGMNLMRPNTAHRRGSRGENGFGLAPIKETHSNLNDKIRVCVRKRPLNRKEKEKGDKDIVNTTGQRLLSVMEPKVKVDMTRYIEESRFSFDEVFDEDADNVQVYARTAKPLVEYVFTGGNATCFAYGQTGSGKTYTMMDIDNGLYIQAADDIFSLLARPEHANLQAFVTFYEIYLTNLYDLLNDRKKLAAREDANQNVCVQGIREVLIQSPEDLMSIFGYGNNCRSTGSTGANADSSRSHAIMQIALKDMSQRKPVMFGKLSFIDLAGNERGSDRGDKANKQTLMEGSEINKSLLALKECIRSLDMNKKHQPFRQSKLTMVLKDSFLGNSRACMVATISPNTSNSDNTLNTLRYADRVKAMKSTSSGNQPESNQNANDEARDTDDYYGSNEFDPTYEDDSGERAYEEEMATSALYTSSHDAFREDDEYVDFNSMDDEFSNSRTTYGLRRNNQPPATHQHQHQQQNQHLRRPSMDDILSQEIGEEAPSLLDEQPAFMDDEVRQPSARSPPRSYGSPAAKNFVSARMPKSPAVGNRRTAPSKLSEMIVRSRRTPSPSDVRMSPRDVDMLSPDSSMRQVLGSNARRLDDVGRSDSMNSATESRVPMMSRSSSSSATHDGQHDVRMRSNTQSSINGGERALVNGSTMVSPYASAVSVPSDSSNSAQGNGAGMDDVAEPSGVPVNQLKVADVDAFVKLHRAQIRSTTEACKEETMLISGYTTFSYAQLVQQAKNKAEGSSLCSSSWQQQQTQGLADKYHMDIGTGVVTRLTDGIQFESVDKAKLNEAMEYLEKLDEVLSRKQQLVVDLRAEIRKLVWDSQQAASL